MVLRVLIYFIMSMDGLSGLQDGVEAVFPNTVVQRCIVHLIRNAIKFIPSKDYKEFTKDLKTIYSAVNLTEAERQFEKLSEKWSKYNGAIRVFERPGSILNSYLSTLLA